MTANITRSDTPHAIRSIWKAKPGGIRHEMVAKAATVVDDVEIIWTRINIVAQTEYGTHVLNSYWEASYDGHSVRLVKNHSDQDDRNSSWVLEVDDAEHGGTGCGLLSQTRGVNGSMLLAAEILVREYSVPRRVLLGEGQEALW